MSTRFYQKFFPGDGIFLSLSFWSWGTGTLHFLHGQPFVFQAKYPPLEIGAANATALHGFTTTTTTRNNSSQAESRTCSRKIQSADYEHHEFHAHDGRHCPTKQSLVATMVGSRPRASRRGEMPVRITTTKRKTQQNTTKPQTTKKKARCFSTSRTGRMCVVEKGSGNRVPHVPSRLSKKFPLFWREW